MLLAATVVLTMAAWLRGAEYDEQYTLFVTAGTPRPVWSDTVFPAGTVAAIQAGHGTLGGIAADLRATDVHPPLYFWALWLWRWVFGPSLFAARMLSVVCAVASLWLTGQIATRCGIRPVLAMLLTLGCYGFVYTGAIARGYALAEMLILSGVLLLLEPLPPALARESGSSPLFWRASSPVCVQSKTQSVLDWRVVWAGVCFGAASCCNYLAAFVAVAAILSVAAWPAILAMVPFLTMDGWFLAVQHASRSGQFPPFAFVPSLARLGGYQVAAVFGGLPLYVDGVWRWIVSAGVGLVALALCIVTMQVRPWRTIRVLVTAALGPPVGLLLLGITFSNTPIELRYLSFGLPFIALLSAYALASGQRRSRVVGWSLFGHARRPVRERQMLDACRDRIMMRSSGWLALRAFPDFVQRFGYAADRAVDTGGATQFGRDEACRHTDRRCWFGVTLVIGTVQAAGLVGLLLAPQTMQPARHAATAAARLAGDGVVLVPAGNDGVGIVGAFGIEAPPALPMLVVQDTGALESRLAPFQRVALAALGQDQDSKASIATVRAMFAAGNWRCVAIEANLEVYERTYEGTGTCSLKALP